MCKKELDETHIRLIITGMLCIACTASMIASGGQTGIGWFILGIYLIW